MSAFNWKIVEEKPENFAEVRVLIEDVLHLNSEESSKKYLRQQASTLLIFVQVFDLQKYFPVQAPGKNARVSSKDLIRNENEKKITMDDYNQFQLNNDYSLKNIDCKIEVNQYLYFFWWAITLLRKLKSKVKVPPLALLDATLSINAILNEELLKTPYLDGFQKVYALLNRLIMNQTFYDVLFANPKLLYHCSFQTYRKTIKLYPEQREILQKINTCILDDKPLLLANQMPTGQGKTFLSIPLAKLLSLERNKEKKKTILFACSNPLVNIDVAQNALVGTDIHLWQARIMRVEDTEKQNDQASIKEQTFEEELYRTTKMKVILRPHKRCFPSIWKTVYKNKKDDKMKNGTIQQQWHYYTKHTGKTPDIIICDLDACLMLLRQQEQLDNPFVGYIDEVISDDVSNHKMVDILKLLPKQTVLLSSVLPKFENIQSVVDSFCERHSTTSQQCCHRVSTADVSIPCSIIDQNGMVRFPHHQISTKEDLQSLIHQIQVNPRIRRTYSPKYVFFWTKEIEAHLPEGKRFKDYFPSIGAIHPRKIVDYVVVVLDYLLSNFSLLSVFQNYRPYVMSSMQKKNLFTKHSNEFDPKTLVVLQKPLPETVELTSTLFEGKVKLSKLVQQAERSKQSIQKEMNTMKKKQLSVDAKKSGASFDKTHHVDELDLLEESSSMVQIEIPKKMIINHVEHFRKYNPNASSTPPTVSSLSNISIPEIYLSTFSDEEIYQFYAGIGTYDRSQQTDYQSNLVMRLYHNFLFFNSGKEIVYGTNLPALTNIVIDDSFVQTINICELYQLMGRVGRKGRSYTANIIACDESVVTKCLSLDDSFEKENQIEQLFH